MGNPPPKGSLTRTNFGKVRDAVLSLKKGDWFDYPFCKRSSVYDAASKHGVKITARMLEDNKTVRFWRI